MDGKKKRTNSENEIQTQLLAEYTRGIPDYDYEVPTDYQEGGGHQTGKHDVEVKGLSAGVLVDSRFDNINF